MTSATYPKLGFVEWFVIGYEEARLGYLYLASKHGLSDIVPDYLRLLHDLPHWDHVHGCHWPPNSWHISGAQDFVTDFTTQHTVTPYCDTLPLVLTIPTEACGWCRRPATDCYMDAIQDGIFCCTEHAMAHRRRTLELMPHIATLYDTYKFQPLHYDQLKLKRYLQGLPDIFDGTLVSHAPINLPVIVNEIKIVREVSTGNLPSSIVLDED